MGKDIEIKSQVMKLLSISEDTANKVISGARELYVEKMRERFTKVKLSERLKRTNPFLLRIRGIKTIREWAEIQVNSALYASEEEATGHLLEHIAKCCHPKAEEPEHTDDLDFMVKSDDSVKGYQVKMSWDCMPMSSRKNLSNTIKGLKKLYKKEDKTFTGYFTPCYGRKITKKPPGQEYITMSSREFWKEVGDNDSDYDVKVGEVCSLLCTDFRENVIAGLVEELVDNLSKEALPIIGNKDGTIDYKKLFRTINK